MPIYEFKCLKCGEHLELLVMNKDEKIELKCSKCDSVDLERILSCASFATGNGPTTLGPSTNTTTCASGSCTTYDIPGHSR